MDAILKKENVYIAVMSKDAREEVDFTKSNDLILCSLEDITNNYLYGGRVKLYLKEYACNMYCSNICHIEIDGIKLERPVSRDSGKIELVSTYELSHAVAYLNQIENLGIDSFLENYKLQLQELKSELAAQAENMQQELAINYDDDKAKVLNSIREVIFRLVCIIFALLVNMNAGLENHHYTDAYDNIINLYF